MHPLPGNAQESRTPVRLPFQGAGTAGTSVDTLLFRLRMYMFPLWFSDYAVVPASTNKENPNPYRLGFFCPKGQYWRGFGHWPRERATAERHDFGVFLASLSLFFSAALVNVLDHTPSIDAGLRAAACGWRLLHRSGTENGEAQKNHPEVAVGER